MIDAFLILLSRAPFDYAKATMTSLLTNRHYEEPAKSTEGADAVSAAERKPKFASRRLGYAITGLVFIVLAGPLFVIGMYTILTSLLNL